MCVCRLSFLYFYFLLVRLAIVACLLFVCVCAGERVFRVVIISPVGLGAFSFLAVQPNGNFSITHGDGDKMPKCVSQQQQQRQSK